MKVALILFFSLAAPCWGFEHAVNGNPNFIIAGDIPGFLEEGGAYHKVDPVNWQLPVTPERKIRVEIEYQSEKDRQVAIDRNETSFLVKLNIQIGETTYRVQNVRVPVVSDNSDDKFTDLAIDLGGLINDLYQPPRLSPPHLFRAVTIFMERIEKRLHLADGKDVVLLNDAKARIPNFTQFDLKNDSQLLRDVFTAYRLGKNQIATSCAMEIMRKDHRTIR